MGGLMRLVALVIGILACVAVPAAQVSAAPRATCHASAQAAATHMDAASLADGLCLSLSLGQVLEYALCWPGTSSSAGPGGSPGSAATGSPAAASGTRVDTVATVATTAAAFEGGALPGARSSCHVPHPCVCVSIGGEPAAPAWITVRQAPDTHARGCLILGAQTTGVNPDVIRSRIVILNL